MENQRWLVGENRYKGERLLLRRPEIIDVKALLPRFPVLATITHELEGVTSDGLPERAYNESLADLDHEIITAFDGGNGTVVLVETFSGERNYYFYIAEGVDVSKTAAVIMRQYPNAKLSTFSKPDPAWNFLARYAKDYF